MSKVRHDGRAVLRDGSHPLFPRREWPGGTPYRTTAGGAVESPELQPPNRPPTA
jgi:hypothetical protein